MLSVRMVCQGTGPCGPELGATKMTKYTLGSTMKRMQFLSVVIFNKKNYLLSLTLLFKHEF